MEATSLLRSSILPAPPLLTIGNLRTIPIRSLRRSKKGKILANARDFYGWDYRENRVDESMIVLRRRIHEMEAVERNYEPPVEWMEWEKQLYASKDAYVCQFVGVLQTQLMNSRPCVALGMLGLVAMSLPVSGAMIISQLLGIADGVLSAVHLS